ncbi:hypothetical protein TR51_29325 [Kitasatospora griseola]|uniref:Uncharacterized protein n=2 Tax=Kitasatospora griseola TaxID=2064 RepID=A0A0D0PK86_KITGR|nr:hypothetical protein TR51_29325 [Kitasatospora griseola]PJN22186.1 hypothetical protein CG736_29030 [Kitasatospora sp. CB02891]GGR03812.1 hypothetical protein GCM10010195_69230 [Kitasatospora griseola]
MVPIDANIDRGTMLAMDLSERGDFVLKARRILISTLLLGITVFLGAGPASADSHWFASQTPSQVVSFDSYW